MRSGCTPNRRPERHSRSAADERAEAQRRRHGFGRAAEEKVEQEGRRNVVGVMAEKNCAATAATCDAREKLVTRISSCGFDRLFCSASERGHVSPRDLAIHPQLFCKRLDELRVRVARLSTQSMIEMTNDQPFVAETRQAMQKRNRIATAGYADQVAAGGRKFGDQFRRQRKLHVLRRHQGASVYKPPFRPTPVWKAPLVG